MNLDGWIEEGLEEGETLDVIHVEMAEQDVDSPLLTKLGTERADPTPRVEDE